MTQANSIAPDVTPQYAASHLGLFCCLEEFHLTRGPMVLISLTGPISVSIFQKLHFSKSNFSERPQEKYDHVTILHSKSLKKCHKIFVPGNNFE